MFLPSSWSDGGLGSIFTETYTKPIATYYPYTPATVTPAQPASTAISTTGMRAASPSGTASGLKTTLAVSICVGVTCISFFIWLITRRLIRHSTLNKAKQPNSAIENIPAEQPRNYKQDSDYITFSTSGTYFTDEKSGRPQTALPVNTFAEFTPMTTQHQVDTNLIFELDSELYYHEQLGRGANGDKHVQTNASNCHPTNARSHGEVLQKTATCITSRFVHRKHSDGHKQSHRLRRFKTLQSNIKPNHRLRVHCQKSPNFLLHTDVSVDGGAFL